MGKKLLVSRPRHDIVVNYLFRWNKELIELAEHENFTVKDLEGKNANKRLFEQYIKKQKPILILLNGHGSPTMVCGHNDEPLVGVDTNVEILSDAVVHALSCDSSLVLGKAAVDNGAKAYIGYNLPFTILTDKYNECRPDCDKLAEIFKCPAIEAQKNLIKSKPVGEAYKKAKEKYKQTILSFSTSDSPKEAEAIRFALFMNMESLTLHTFNGDFAIG